MEARDTQPLEGRRQRGRGTDETLSHSPRNYSNLFSCTLIWPAAIKKNFYDNLSLLFLVIQREDNEDCDFFFFLNRRGTATPSTAQKSWQKHADNPNRLDHIRHNKTDKDQMTLIYVNVHVGTASESFRRNEE